MTGMICPTCRLKGRGIKQLTIDSLAQDSVASRLRTREGFGYCTTPTCPVAWFQPETGEIVDKSELKVRIGMKETSGLRPICYCFGHDRGKVQTGPGPVRRNKPPGFLLFGQCESSNLGC